MDDSAFNPHILKTLSQLFKYIGIGLTSVISLHSLTKETFDKEKRKLTPAGKRHQILLIVSGLLALIGALVENSADTALKVIASDEGDKKFQQRLQNANSELMTNLQPRFDSLITAQQNGTKESVRQINEATHGLQTSLNTTIPLEGFAFTIRLSDFAKLGLTFHTDNSIRIYGQRRVHAGVRLITTDINWPVDWYFLVCSGVRLEHPWSLHVPITASVEALLGRADQKEALPSHCQIPAHGFVGNGFDRWEFTFDQESKHVDTVVFDSPDVGRIWVPENYRWNLNIRSLETIGEPTLVLDEQPTELLVPRRIEVEVSASSTGLPIQKRKWVYALIFQTEIDLPGPLTLKYARQDKRALAKPGQVNN